MSYPTPPPSPKPLCRPEDRVGSVIAGLYQLTDVLGVGAYGTVYEARHVETNAQYAVKALNKVGLDPRQRAFQDREIKLHHRASHHPNVVSMVQILDSAECTFVILEYCSEGDLFSRITEDGDYIGCDLKARSVFLQILDAVQHCHANGVYHRDLKPENVLVKDNGWTVKLADFGLATQDRLTSDFGCGSTFYMSPECQQSNPKPFACYASEANDVWSLGVILVNLTCGRNPWKRAAVEDSTFRAYLRNRNFLQSILPISDGLNFILKRIFEVNPKFRVGLDELRHLIQNCPRLSQEPESLPPTPPYSPIGKPVDSFIFDLEPDVPEMPPLPVQQHPSFANSRLAVPQQPFTQPALQALPGSTLNSYPTPPSSTRGSPYHGPYTSHAKPATTNFNGPALGSASFIPSIFGTRCSNIVPSLANQACWRNVMVS